MSPPLARSSRALPAWLRLWLSSLVILALVLAPGATVSVVADDHSAAIAAPALAEAPVALEETCADAMLVPTPPTLRPDPGDGIDAAGVRARPITRAAARPELPPPRA